MGWIFMLVLLVGACYTGQQHEKKHYARIVEREKAMLDLPSLTTQHTYKDANIEDCKLVTGSVVISGDYFKMMLASLLKFFGGRIVGYESLIDRARRESLLRMKEEAKQFGASAVINTRFEMSKLDGSGGAKQSGTGMFELLAYGTAIKIK